MNAVAARAPAAARVASHTARSRCAHCGQPLPAIPDAHVAVCTPTPVKQYALERIYSVKRMNGGFV